MEDYAFFQKCFISELTEEVCPLLPYLLTEIGKINDLLWYP